MRPGLNIGGPSNDKPGAMNRRRSSATEIAMVKNYEKAVGESSEWRTPKALLDAIGLTYAVDPCAPLDGYYAVQAEVRFTMRDNGLLRPWPPGLAFVNPPWSETRRAVVPWLKRWNAHDGGGIFVCVARTSDDWFQEFALPHSDQVCFPASKTRFNKPDGSPGSEPTNGVAILARGEVAVEALRKSGLGHCLFVDRSATPSPRIAKLNSLAERG